MADLRVGGSVRLSQASSDLATSNLDRRDRKHLERFLELPSLQQSYVPSNMVQPGLATIAAGFAEPELHNPQVLRAQNFVYLLSSIDEQLSKTASDDPVVKLTRLVLQQELKKHDLLREQVGALVER